MRTRVSIALVISVLFAVSAATATAYGSAPLHTALPQTASGTAFTYQGQLKQGSTSVNDQCDFQFSLWDAASAGTQIGLTQTLSTVDVVNGLFTVSLDFGANTFTGAARWLAIAVRCPKGSGEYTALNPRQPLTPAPYAAYAIGNWGLRGNSGVNANNFLGTTDNTTLTLGVNNAATLRLIPAADAPIVIGGYAGNAVNGLGDGSTIAGGGSSYNGGNIISGTNVIWSTIGGGAVNQINGNAFQGTIGGGLNNVINGTSAYRATIGGGFQNRIAARYGSVSGGYSSTVAAGADFGTIAGGRENQVSSYEAAVGGGRANAARGGNSVIGGGYANTASGGASFIGGGQANVVTPTATYGVLGGGLSNSVNAEGATISGGKHNTAAADHSAIGGGYYNFAGGSFATIGGGAYSFATGSGATIGGGSGNFASGDYAAIGGGGLNMVGGYAATVPGGLSNVASMSYTLAAGHRAQANQQGAFVWADSTEADFASTGNDQFLIRANGGVGINTNNPQAAALAVQSNTANSGNNTAQFYAPNIGPYASNIHYGPTGDWYIRSAASTGKVILQDTGGKVGIGTSNPATALEVNGWLTLRGLGPAGSMSLCFNAVDEISTCSSSLRYKNSIENLPLGLDTVTHLRSVTFNWKTNGEPDLGFVAEEVNQVSPLLTTRNKDGQIEGVKYDRISAVLVKAIQEQQQQLAELKAQNTAQQQELTQLKRSSATDQSFTLFNVISLIALGGVIAIGLRQKRGGQA